MQCGDATDRQGPPVGPAPAMQAAPQPCAHRLPAAHVVQGYVYRHLIHERATPEYSREACRDSEDVAAQGGHRLRTVSREWSTPAASPFTASLPKASSCSGSVPGATATGGDGPAPPGPPEAGGEAGSLPRLVQSTSGWAFLSAASLHLCEQRVPKSFLGELRGAPGQLGPGF